MSSETSRGIVIGLDVYSEHGYVSAECQFGAHHACPGGLRGDTTHGDWICHCALSSCDCYVKLAPQGLIRQQRS